MACMSIQWSHVHLTACECVNSRPCTISSTLAQTEEEAKHRVAVWRSVRLCILGRFACLEQSPYEHNSLTWNQSQCAQVRMESATSCSSCANARITCFQPHRSKARARSVEKVGISPRIVVADTLLQSVLCCIVNLSPERSCECGNKKTRISRNSRRGKGVNVVTAVQL